MVATHAMMADSPEAVACRPTLTVMPDFGMGPFLWHAPHGLLSHGIGGNCCDAIGACGQHPMPDWLHSAFREWVMQFESLPCRKGANPQGRSRDWSEFHWSEFHGRGLTLAGYLKHEVGPSCRVIYVKPYEDPLRRIDQAREILENGAVAPLPNSEWRVTESFQEMVHVLLAGAETGTARAVLDWAIAHNHPHSGGCASQHARADGPSDACDRRRMVSGLGADDEDGHALSESDGALIFSLGRMSRRARQMRRLAGEVDRPVHVQRLDNGVTRSCIAAVHRWLTAHPILKLFVAGPTEAESQGIYALTYSAMNALRDYRESDGADSALGNERG